MVLPPSQRLWVGMLVVIVAVVELPVSLQKCIFDEVQAQTRVLRAADSPPNEPRPRAQAGQQSNNPERMASPLRRRRSLRKMAPPARVSPQPIRIRTWIARESSNLSGAEKERLEAAVEEAVRMVSSLLSGDKQTTHTHTHMHVHTHT